MGQRPQAEPSAAAGGSTHLLGGQPLGPDPVIGLAHGSRLPAAARDIEVLVAAVGRQGQLVAEPAFLDLAEPDLEAVVRELAAAGHRRAIVVPLLFTAAFHATVDVPEAVQAAADSVGIELVVTDILGTGDDVAELLAASLAAAGVPDEVSVLLFAVGSSRPAANEAVVALADRLARDRTGRVRVAFGTTDPRLDAVLPELGEPVALLPLFLADGLLLAPLRRLAERSGWTLIEPIADRAAELVLARYRAGAGR